MHALNWPLKEADVEIRHHTIMNQVHLRVFQLGLNALSPSQCFCLSHIHPRIKLPFLSIPPLRNPEVYSRHSGANHLSSGAAAVHPGEGMATRRQGEGQS